MFRANGTCWKHIVVMLSVLLAGIGLPLSSPSTAAASGRATVEVVITEVHELDNVDNESYGDYYAKVWIGDSREQRTGAYSDRPNIRPNWTFKQQVDRDSWTSVTIQLWDKDGGLNGGDDQVDINPNPGRSLELSVNTSRQGLKYQDEVPIEGVAVSGETVWAPAAGDENDRARIYFTIRVYFDPLLTIHNESGRAVCHIYISPSSSSDWGDDWLTPPVLEDGYYVTAQPTADTYDLSAEFCSGESDTRFSIALYDDYDWIIQ